MEAAPGSHLAILGPSGCGKTTLLRTIAGLQRVDSGEVWLGDDLVAAPGVHVAPEERRVGLVFQDWALFPHLTVAANVAYGLPRGERWRRFGRTRPRAREAVGNLLEMVGVAELADRLPGSLSGGQQQRVALARALAPRPSVLLFDEPFSSLDTHLRAGVRTEVALLLRELKITSIFVTHDQDEAFVLGDEVAVMRDGVIVQQASPAELYSRPVDSWLAEFVGDAELIAGDATGDVAATSIGPVALAEASTGAVRVLVRPEEIVLTVGHGGTVVEVEYHGHDTLTVVQLGDRSILRSRSTGAPQFVVGDEVTVGHSGARARSYPVAGPAPVGVTAPPAV
jgi:iron(III) transport system ATP-binding protein